MSRRRRAVRPAAVSARAARPSQSSGGAVTAAPGSLGTWMKGERSSSHPDNRPSARPGSAARRRWPGRRSAPPSAGCPWNRPAPSWPGPARTARSAPACAWVDGRPGAAQAGQQADDLAAGQARPQGHVAGHVGEPFVQRDRVPPRVAAEQAGRAAVLAQQAEQDADGGGLARSVRPEEGCTSPDRTVRSRPSSAVVRPNDLRSARTSIAFVMAPVMASVYTIFTKF